MNLKNIRQKANLTQKQAADIVGISLRSYKHYETNPGTKINNLKYIKICEIISKHLSLDEEHGVLSTKQIIKLTKNIFVKYNLEYVYLFGSYAKNSAKPTSDVDLLISNNIDGIYNFEFVEELREVLSKKVDIINVNNLNSNKELLDNVLKDGIKIYG